MIKLSLSFLVCFVLFVGILPLYANETDQYNLPPVPLADIAPEIETYVAQHIQTAIEKLNADIAKHEACISTSDRTLSERKSAAERTCRSLKEEGAAIEKLRSPDTVARAVYDQLGAGNIFISDTGKWLNTHKFEAQPPRYTAPYSESIYVSAPVDYATISPTIRVYGVEFGTDKFDHLFQQGYTYYRKYNAALKAGKSEADALKTVVAYGRFTENTFFGYTVSGVYSNADLAANIAGLFFYRSLANDVYVGKIYLPPVVGLFNGHWRMRFTPDASKMSSSEFTTRVPFPSGKYDKTATAMERHDRGTSEGAKYYDLVPAGAATGHNLLLFITDHLNEAYNPSNYLFFLYPVVKRVVKKRACPEWRAALPTATHASIAARTAALTTWNGLDYGYKTTSRQVRLADVCFADDKGSAVKEEK